VVEDAAVDRGVPPRRRRDRRVPGARTALFRRESFPLSPVFLQCRRQLTYCSEPSGDPDLTDQSTIT
jgi:hypothetical protein